MTASALETGWLIVDGLPMYHRWSERAAVAAPDAAAMVHVHGFGISGTYLVPTAERLAHRWKTYVPDLPGVGLSRRPKHPPDLPGLARSVLRYCDAVGVERATFVGNSLGCPLIVEIAAQASHRVERAVLVSPAGGPHNQPLPRALAQMIRDSYREPLGMLPIAVKDYLRFGVIQSFRLFRSMTEYPTLERVEHLQMPTLAIAGDRDPLVSVERAKAFSGLPHMDAVVVPGAHALNYSRPDVVAALIQAHADGALLRTATGPLSAVQVLEIPAV